MTQNPQTAQEGITSALQDLSENSRTLVWQEIGAAQQEIQDKGRQAAPAFTLLAATAALVAIAGYGADAAVLGLRRLRELPPLLPTDIARQAKETVTSAVTAGTGNTR